MINVSRSIRSASRKLLASLLLAGVCLGSSQTAQADIDARLGHTALPTVGRDTGITHVELFPYYMIEDEQILFGDMRGFITNDGKLGGNFGAGYRFLEPNEIFILGVNGFYDADQSSGKTYQQLGFGLEALTRFGSLTTNFYFPVGSNNKTMQEEKSNARFEGNQILFDHLLIRGEAMQGVDLMLGVFLPGEFAQEHQIELSSGWYQFHGSNVETINGFKIQLDGQILPALDAQVAVTSDDYFGTKTTLGLSWRFGNRELPSSDVDRQLRRFVDRNYNVVVADWNVSGNGIALTKADGSEYIVKHVSDGSITGDGTYESPFADFNDAQTGADIIYVHSDTTISESIVLQDGQILLGQGTSVTLQDSVFGDITVFEESTGATPTILNPVGVAGLTMANNTMVSGINIDGAFGDAILVDGFDNYRIENVNINNSQGNGISIDGATNGLVKNVNITGGDGAGIRVLNVNDELTFQNIQVEGVAGNGVHIEGGQGTILFEDELVLNDVQGSSFFVGDLFTTEDLIDDQGTTDTDDDEYEVTEGTVIVEKIKIDGADGGVGIELQDNDGYIEFGDVDITTTNGAALRFRNTNRAFIAAGDLNSTGAAAADIEDSYIDMRLQSLSVDGGPNAIRMINSTGWLLVFGTGEEGTGGTIKNTDVAIVMEDSTQMALQTMNFVDNNMIAQLTDSSHFELAAADITGTKTQFIDALNVKTLTVFNSDFTDNELTETTGINVAVDKTGGYIASFISNEVTEGPSNMFNIETLAGGEGASLTYTMVSNSITMDHVGGIAAKIDWTGAAQADVRNNLILGEADNQTAFDFNFGTSTGNAIVLIQQNGIGMEGANSFGIKLATDAPMTAQLNQNLIQLNGLDGTGMQLSSTKAATISLTRNQIEDYAGGGTGIIFPTLYDGSTINFNSNVIDLSRFNNFVDRGFILSAVGGVDDPTVQINSTSNNVISGASTIYSIPEDNVTGQLYINGEVIR